MWPVLFFNIEWSFEIYMSVPVEIFLVNWWYKAMNFSLHYSIKYYKNNNNCFPSILNLFFS